MEACDADGVTALMSGARCQMPVGLRHFSVDIKRWVDRRASSSCSCSLFVSVAHWRASGAVAMRNRAAWCQRAGRPIQMIGWPKGVFYLSRMRLYLLFPKPIHFFMAGVVQSDGFLAAMEEASSRSGYLPLVGNATSDQFVSACRELERLRMLQGDKDHEGEVRVLVARDVPTQHWKETSVDARRCRWEAALSPDGPYVSVELLDVFGPEHAAAVRAVSSQYPHFTTQDQDSEILVLNGDGSRRIEIKLQSGSRIHRKPDSGIWPVASLAGDAPPLPRFILDVECEGRYLTYARRFCRRYFEGSMAIRALLLIKFFRLRHNKTRACVAILLLRTDCDAVVVADVVSFGSAPLSRATIAALPAIDPAFRTTQAPFRDLPRAPLFNSERNRMPRCPWGLLDRAEVRVPHTALFYQVAQPHAPSNQAASPIGNIRIQLWPVYAAFESAFH